MAKVPLLCIMLIQLSSHLRADTMAKKDDISAQKPPKGPYVNESMMRASFLEQSAKLLIGQSKLFIIAIQPMSDFRRWAF